MDSSAKFISPVPILEYDFSPSTFGILNTCIRERGRKWNKSPTSVHLSEASFLTPRKVKRNVYAYITKDPLFLEK